MTKWGSADGFLLVDGYDLAGVSTSLEDNVQAMTEDAMGMGDSWPEPTYVGLKSWGMTQQGYYDDAADSSHTALVSSNGVNRVVCFGYEGGTLGTRFAAASGALQVSYDRSLSRGELHKANATYQGSGRFWEGVILHALSEETADGNTESDGVDNGAASLSGGIWFVQVPALDLDGHTGLAIKLRHSSDDITYTDKDTATTITSAPGSEARVLAGTINRYAACSWDFTGAGTSPTATVFVGVARG